MQHGDSCQKAEWPVKNWPANWHQCKIDKFKDRVAPFGMIPEEGMMTAANAVENLGADIEDFVDYLMSVQVTQKKLADNSLRFSARVFWSRCLFDFIGMGKSNNFLKESTKLLVIVVLSPFIFLANLPARVSFNLENNRLCNGLCNNFMEFLVYKRKLCKW